MVHIDGGVFITWRIWKIRQVCWLVPCICLLVWCVCLFVCLHSTGHGSSSIFFKRTQYIRACNSKAPHFSEKEGSKCQGSWWLKRSNPHKQPYLSTQRGYRCQLEIIGQYNSRPTRLTMNDLSKVKIVKSGPLQKAWHFWNKKLFC